ncbi:Type I restriction-modification system, S subunit [Pararhodospirillum photometricum DSM 122]|uniref:Type I restriction-modification system, S subunit n=1 Tax=Pararhodospirillum photometricum DSM 122 TaxID=1150469 RepID=H6SPK8_PARPM|nr:Type I restriction-modification system, S subunit [Pararhodospirillum photometricum DSM 122]
MMAVIPREGVLLPEFLLYLFSRKNLSDFASDSNPPSIRKTEVEEWEISIPPLDEQRRIVDILNHAASIRRLREEARAKAREIIPALFVEMFGDPATNPKGWPETNVGEVADVQGGLQLTKKRDALLLEMPYLRVANVHRNLLVLDEIKTIRVTEVEKERVKLHGGDLLIVEGHGNPEEIGRVAVWDGSIPECLHQNHLIRARCREGISLPKFLSAFLNSQTGRQQLLRQGKTTSGLNTISTSNVKRACILLPPIALQQEFAERVAEVEGILSLNDRAATAAEQTAQSLLAQAFGQAA